MAAFLRLRAAFFLTKLPLFYELIDDQFSLFYFHVIYLGVGKERDGHNGKELKMRLFLRID